MDLKREMSLFLKTSKNYSIIISKVALNDLLLQNMINILI